MELTALQREAVEKLLASYNRVRDDGANKVVAFKAPTGSGKTLMASSLISNLIDRNRDEKFLFVVATVSSASLPLVFEQKLNVYKKDLPYSRFEVEYVRSPSSSKGDKTESTPKLLPERNKVFIFGKASFGKGRILSEYGIIEDFVRQAVEQNYRLVYIRDEAHIGARESGRTRSDAETKKFEDMMSVASSFVVKMTATPEPGITCVELRERDLNDPMRNGGLYLLKTKAETFLDSSLADTQILDEACKKFKVIQKEYAALNIGVRPAMLIQVENSSSEDAEKKENFEKALADAKATLTRHGLSWAQYFGDGEKESDRVYGKAFTLDDLTKNTNEIDVVLFKLGPATGWDIPRACMLVQMRKVLSASLTIQTVGRIKRNPYPGLQRNDVTDKYYLLSNEETASVSEKEVKRFEYAVSEKFKKEKFLSIEIKNRKEVERDAGEKKEFRKQLAEFLDGERNHLRQLMCSAFSDGAYVKVLMTTAQGREIKSYVRNAFVFLRDYKRLVARNCALVKMMGNVVEKWAKKENVQVEWVMTLLLEHKLKEIRELLQRTRKIVPEYRICERESYNPSEYCEVYGENVSKGGFSGKKYLFTVKEDSQTEKQQPLDSEPEKIVFNKIFDFADEHDGVMVWAKNQTMSNVYGDYLDENLEIRKSYFDFIIKFENGMFLYLEVKGKDDIDPEKTKLLQKAYKQYFIKRDLFSPKLAIAVCRVDEKGALELDVQYDEESACKLEDYDLETLMGVLAKVTGL